MQRTQAPSTPQKPVAARPTLRRRVRVLKELERWIHGPMLVLSFAWLMFVFAELLWPREHLLEVFGTAIWVIFVLEFAVRFAIAPDKRRFLVRNWLTALALIVPALRIAPFLGALRFLVAAQGGELLVLLGTVNRTMNALQAGLQRRKAAFVFVLTIIVTLLGAGGMLAFEPHAATTGTTGFTGYGDALWWTAMLMTTIGSAYWPQTSAGRVLGFLLSVYAIAVFGYLTASLSSIFVGQDASDKSGPVAGSDDIAALRREIAGLRTDLRAALGPKPEPPSPAGADAAATPGQA